jgi:iron(III) transport system ATP-binding protein
MGTTIAIRNATKQFGPKKALDDVSLDIAAGEFFTLLGPSGCGKTTLLRAIAGFNDLSGGSILFDGKDVVTLEAWKRGIGFVFQNYALWPNKTVFENVAYGLRIKQIDAATIKSKVADALAMVRLVDVEQRYPGEMSGGMQQRIAIARALVVDPPILLLDEPLSNLDAKLRVSLRRDIREIQKRLGLTAVYVTHDQEEALEISDRIAVMSQGRVEQVGTPEDIYERPEKAFVADFVGAANLIKGNVTSGVFSTITGGTVKLEETVTESLVQEGAATLLVRPEHVVLSSGKGKITGIIANHFYAGVNRRYRVVTEDFGDLIVDTAQRYTEGQSIQVSFGAARLMKA